MKKAKAKQSKLNNRYFIITSLIVIFLAVGTLIGWNIFLRNAIFGAPTYQYKTYELTGETHDATGKITSKTTSCSQEVLEDDGSVRRVGGMCDGEDGLTVDKSMHISTGGGGLRASYPKYGANIKLFTPGDTVKIRYVLDEDGRPSINCKECYIKRI